MSTRIALVATSLTLAWAPSSASAGSSISQRKAFLRANIDTDAFQTDLRNALGEVLGCGGPHKTERLAEIEKKMLPIWNSLPKSSSGRIERRLLRYIVHRYFMQTYSIMIRGFEPSRQMNQSLVGIADILSQQVPAYLEAALELQHAQQRGFDMHDAVHMVATLEKLITDSDVTLLEEVYQEQQKVTGRALSRQGLEQVLEDYLVYWLLGGYYPKNTIRAFLKDRSRLKRRFPLPHWAEILEHASGQIVALDFQRQRTPQAFGSGALAQGYTFNDARKVVESITKSFASFWDEECTLMRDKLVEMDTHHTGRVPLSKFYSSTDFRFGESEDYLRELGALDETSRWHGKEVIIPNYIQAASNCLIAAPHYLVCCIDPCEHILGELEVEIGAPVALPSRVLRLVDNMTSQTAIDREDPPQLRSALKKQLEQIASVHGGSVPLHGRLFAQWLHYAFPRECPFPHKTGTTTMVPPREFGEYLVSETDRIKHSNNASSVPLALGKEEMQWMSQWSSEEELISDYADLHAPWEVAWSTAASIILAIIASITSIFGLGQKAADSRVLLPMNRNAQFV